MLRRSGRTLRMTYAGAVFKPHADALLHHLDDGIAAVSQLIEPETGTVTLSFQHSLGTWLVSDLVGSFRAAHLGVQFQLTQVRDELHAPLAEQPLHLSAVADEPFIGLRLTSALRQLTDDLCNRAGFRPAVVFEGDDLSTVRGFVAAGLGVAILPAPRAGSPESAAGPVSYGEIADVAAVREICLMWSAERRLLPAAELFRRHVISRAAAGEVPALSG
jgi:LysR family transcriptional activator of glutamate synthase operon